MGAVPFLRNGDGDYEIWTVSCVLDLCGDCYGHCLRYSRPPFPFYPHPIGLESDAGTPQAGIVVRLFLAYHYQLITRQFVRMPIVIL